MYIIPAIDLRHGRCVRLIQGQYHHQITYENDPVKQAQEFSLAGAEWLHIVDLDGARVGRPVNTDTISAIAALEQFKIEVGGGIRDEASIRQLLDIGAERVIIGTKAVSNFEWFSEMAEKFSGKIVLGLDARGSKVSTHGWTQDSTTDLLELGGDNIYRHYQRRYDGGAKLRKNKGACPGGRDARYRLRWSKRDKRY